VNQDFRDLFAEFNAARVEFLIVGAHALAVHGHVRATRDLDIWTRPDSANALRVLLALESFGAPTQGLTVDDLAHPDLIFQIGVPPIRIDVLTSISGVAFDEAWEARVQTRFGDQAVGVISREHLIRNKRASGRTQDLADLESLEGRSPTA
jgi:hypothetical protein